MAAKQFIMSNRQTLGHYLALCAALFSIAPDSCVASPSWTCSLEFVPLERIPLKGDEGIGGRGRLVRSSGSPPTTNAIIGSRRRDQQRTIPFPDEEGDDNQDGAMIPDGSDGAYQEGRRCHCAILFGGVDDDEAYYCPSPADHCSIWRRRFGGTYRVECFASPSWEVGIARHVWFYLCFAWLVLLMYPFCSRPGQHATRYLLSKCFPRMNAWTAEHLLRTEIQARDLIGEEFERHARRKRRTEGWVSGYRLKTKIRAHPDATTMAEHDGECDVPVDGTELCGRDSGVADDKAEEERDREDEDCTCTICITAVEYGDRVPVLRCGHLFHAECLSEWILNKNLCPLCQGPVAEEIRSFEDSSEDDSVGDVRSEGLASRLRRRVRDGLLDVATGRDRRTHEVHRRRVRDMLNESTEASLAEGGRGVAAG